MAAPSLPARSRISVGATVRRALMPVGQIAVVVIAVVVWEVMARNGALNTFVLGSPSRIVEDYRSWYESGALFTDIGTTLMVLLVGYAIGLACGVALGALLGLSTFARQVLEPFIAYFNGMPRLLLYPLLIVVIGFGIETRMLHVVLAVVVLVAVTVAAGFREISPELLDGLRLAGAGRAQLVLHLYLPSLTLWLLATMRSTLGYAFSAAIVAEYIGATSGIGYHVVQGQASLNVNTIWAAVFVAVAIAVVLYAVLGAVERRATRWLPGDAT